jgi:hypothetical protein
MSLRTALMVAVLSVATLANAGTERDRWLSMLEKYAVYVGTDKVPTVVDAFARAKSACVCTEAGSLFRRPGYPVVGEGTDGLIAFCVVPIFDENGAFESAAGCSTFVPLAK